jgi:trehalose 6-phosphate synthase
MKLIVVSNRLPITVSKNDSSSFNYKKTSGGLVTGIESLSKHLDFIWLGNISGMDLSEKDKKVISTDCWDKFKSVPVFISPELNSLSYDGFCNAILWPVLHSFYDDVCFTLPEYEAYREYNRIFAESILDIAENGDIVWVHDYHLMLVPEIIKKKNPNVKVMFYLHIPFCEPHLLKPLLCAGDIVKSICQCDLISFHMPDYALNFTQAALELLGSGNGGVKGKNVKAIPIGIDPEMFHKCLKEPETIQKIQEIKKRYEGKKIILGVDRTDYIKGLPFKVKGFQRFLERNPELSDKVVLLQIAIPSRQCVTEYSSYVIKMNEIITQTNGSIGNISSTPIHFLYNSVSFSELCALYAVSDMMLITSIIDGFNLVALEYVACQDEKEGVVLLSKFAGAASTIQGCIEFNPANTEEIAETIEKGLKLTKEERKRRHLSNKKNIEQFTSVKWAEDNLKFIKEDWKEELKRE